MIKAFPFRGHETCYNPLIKLFPLHGHETPWSFLIKDFPLRGHESCLSFLINLLNMQFVNPVIHDHFLSFFKWYLSVLKLNEI